MITRYWHMGPYDICIRHYHSDSAWSVHFGSQVLLEIDLGRYTLTIARMR